MEGVGGEYRPGSATICSSALGFLCRPANSQTLAIGLAHKVVPGMLGMSHTLYTINYRRFFFVLPHCLNSNNCILKENCVSPT